MSTVPIAGAGFSTLIGAESSRERAIRRYPGHFLQRAGAELRSVPRYVIRYTLLVLAVFGLMSLWEAHGDGRIPALLPLRSMDPHRVSAPLCAVPGVNDDTRWRGLASVLAILDQVNPDVASWVRQRHEAGAVVFSDEYCRGRDKHGSLAKYDHFGRRLIVQRALFEESDGELAAILCHEFRHSRQNTAKLVKCALSFVVTADGDRSILENDALVYEHEARWAIFGR